MKVSVIAEGGIGIAAPQVGINRNIVWIQRQDKGTIVNRPWECYLNPRITGYSPIYNLRSDGCLSVSPTCEDNFSISGNSWRASWVDVEYYLPDGTFVQERITHALTAHIFQHEIDHLNGIMFFDRQDNPNDK
jgi:peptide deformylase